MARLTAFLMAAAVVAMAAAASESKKDESPLSVEVLPISSYSAFLKKIKPILANSWFDYVKAIKPVVVLYVVDNDAKKGNTDVIKSVYLAYVADLQGSIYAVTWTEGVFGTDVVPFLTFKMPRPKKGDPHLAEETRIRDLVIAGKYKEAQELFRVYVKHHAKKMAGHSRVAAILGHK